MPVYTFTCLKCDSSYDELTNYDSSGKYKDVRCPNCKSKKKVKDFGYEVCCTFGNPKESSKWDNFEYRAGYNMEKAKNDRRAAESKSHMGTNPYKNKKLD